MADELADPDDLISLLDDEIDATQAAAAVRLATSMVQAAAGQRLVAVEDDEITLMGTPEAWLALPERPVTAVSSVEIDGDEVTDFKRFGARLWRDRGWSGSDSPHEPSEVAVTYSHGLDEGDQRLEYARSVTMMAARLIAENPLAATGYSIDDYREQFSQSSEGTSSAITLPRRVEAELRRRYGVRAGLVSIG